MSYSLWLTYSLRLRTLWLIKHGGAKGQNLVHLKKVLFYFTAYADTLRLCIRKHLLFAQCVPFMIGFPSAATEASVLAQRWC